MDANKISKIIKDGKLKICKKQERSMGGSDFIYLLPLISKRIHTLGSFVIIFPDSILLSRISMWNIPWSGEVSKRTCIFNPMNFPLKERKQKLESFIKDIKRTWKVYVDERKQFWRGSRLGMSIEVLIRGTLPLTLAKRFEMYDSRLFKTLNKV